ncbi:hypothetical protein [Armatimonas sp.]|uniref:hypothetical protein n=1 Tax=Armatimonas sp. TaxID=1872638 RepID=UPI00286A1915|nr:hypothetical protein [Armatimonas sp.]
MRWQLPLFDPTDVECLRFHESYGHHGPLTEYVATLEWQGDFVGVAIGSQGMARDDEVELTWPVRISEIFSTTCLQALANVPMHPQDYRPPHPGPMSSGYWVALEIVTSTETLLFRHQSGEGWYVQRNEIYCFCKAQKLVSAVMYTIQAAINTVQHGEDLDAAWEEYQRPKTPKRKTLRSR